MKRVHRIIYYETITPILITLIVLTFVVFTREFGRLAELLIRKNADVITVSKAVIYLMPSILIFTVPFSFLIGTLIGMSRLSADSEVIALRAGGVSIVQMLWPVAKIGLAVFALTASFTLYSLPEGNWKLRLLRHEIGISPVHSEIRPRIFYENFPGVLIYVEDVDLNTSNWEGIFVVDETTPQEKRIILADRGRPFGDDQGRRLQLHFEEGSIYSTPPATPEKVNISQFETLDIPIDIQTGEQVEEKIKRPRDKNLGELVLDVRQGSPDARRTSLVELNRRIALPFSALIFAVLAVTLGSWNPRASRGYGFILSVTVAFTYYLLFATGGSLSDSGVLPIYVGVWGANIVFGILAALTLRHGNRGSSFQIAFSGLPVLSQIFFLVSRLLSTIGRIYSGITFEIKSWAWKLPKLRFRLAQVIDLYMIRTFFFYFSITLLTCLSLVTLFTFFELIDEAFENAIPYSTLLDYFLFLQPHLVMLLIPISILIATLVTFGSLEKTNQVMALKSCGISVYRIATPVIALGLLIAAFVFVMQEYILPYANQRQDNLRNIIKGSPVQTTQPGRSWIFGNENRLFNYNHFNSEQNSFAELSVYRLSIENEGLNEIIYSRHAEWDRFDQSWRLRDGWSRNFVEGSFETFEQLTFKTPETPDYFMEGIQESTKMTYGELQDYIADLQQGGFEVDYLRTALYKKLSFPLVNVIMTMIGLPFALTMGRKGALFGVAAGVLIGIVYWGAFGIFDVLGANGLLAPSLAAWGPNIVFGAGAGVLLSVVRT